jgi:hypothetical protein
MPFIGKPLPGGSSIMAAGLNEMDTACLVARVLPAGTFSTKDALDDGNAYGSSHGNGLQREIY